MNLNKNAWHVRWFNFVQEKIGSSWDYRFGTSLCHFMRVTMLWGPLLILFVLGVIGFIITGFFVVPVVLFGWGALLLWGGIVAAVAMLVGVVRFAENFQRKPGGAIDCVLTYSKAAKSKVCPLIKFEA